MKVVLDQPDQVIRIHKSLPPEQAHGEYLGAAIIEPAVAADLADCLERTWTRDPGLYYEDGFQLLADRCGRSGPLGWNRLTGSRSTTRRPRRALGKSCATTSPYRARPTDRAGATGSAVQPRRRARRQPDLRRR